MRLDGKTALLTGATGGLGRAMAAALAERGARLVLSSRKQDELDALAASLPGDGHRAAVADLALDGAAERLAGEAGEVEILVANAGLPATGWIDDFSEQDLGRALRVNLEVPIRLARALAPAMATRGEGHVVLVSSLAGKAATPRSSLYNATKFGLRGFAFGLRCDLAGKGVGVSVVAPGFIRDAGMFAESGASPPPGMGTTTPAAVGAAVVRAIERDVHEIAVAPRRQRALAHLGLVSPRIAVAVGKGGTADRASAALARGQVDKR